MIVIPKILTITCSVLLGGAQAFDANRLSFQLAFSNVASRIRFRQWTPLLMASYSASIMTPPTGICHNFGPVSPRDHTLYTAERPGNSYGKESPVPSTMVNEWIAFMKDRGIGHVIVLLDDNELGVYEDHGLLEIYKNSGFSFLQVPMSETGAYERITTYLQRVHEKGEKAVTHCTGGTGRAGRVAAAWLVHQYKLDVEEATKETVDIAFEKGICRLGHAEKLAQWTGKY